VLVVGRLAKLFPESFSGVGRLDSHTLGYGSPGRKPGDRCTTPAVQDGSAGHWKPGEAGARVVIGPRSGQHTRSTRRVTQPRRRSLHKGCRRQLCNQRGRRFDVV
jgi:hypothetical protein